MKTAVSIPDDIFERAERLARRNQCSRSEVYAAALDEYVARHAHEEVTDALNRVCDEVGGESDDFLAAAGRRILDRVEWSSAGYLSSNVVPSFFATGVFSSTT